MNHAIDIYVWRRCGFRVMISARANPADDLRLLVAHLDRMAERSWAELIGCHNAGQQYAGDWLEERGLPRAYARQMICLAGCKGPLKRYRGHPHTTRMRDNDEGKISRHETGREDWLTESDPADTGVEAQADRDP